MRWRDLDAFRHVNNATFVTYLEIARTELWRKRFVCTDPMDIPFVIAGLNVEYKRPIKLNDTVRVGLRTTDICGSSFAFEYRIESEGQTAALAHSVQVCIRHESGRPVRVPESLRRDLSTLLVDTSSTDR